MCLRDGARRKKTSGSVWGEGGVSKRDGGSGASASARASERSSVHRNDTVFMSRIKQDEESVTLSDDTGHMSDEESSTSDTDETTGYPVADSNLMRIAEHGFEVASRSNHHGHRQRCRKLPAGRDKCALAVRSNTAILPFGNAQNAKTNLYYNAKYLSKNPVEQDDSEDDDGHDDGMPPLETFRVLGNYSTVAVAVEHYSRGAPHMHRYYNTYIMPHNTSL